MESFPEPKNFIERRALEQVIIDYPEVNENLKQLIIKFGYLSKYLSDLSSPFKYKKIVALEKLSLLKCEKALDNMKKFLESEKDIEVINYAVLSISNFIFKKEDIDWFLIITKKLFDEEKLSKKTFSIAYENNLRHIGDSEILYLLENLLNLCQNEKDHLYCSYILDVFYFELDNLKITKMRTILLKFLDLDDDILPQLLKILSKIKRESIEDCNIIKPYLLCDNSIVQMYALRLVRSWQCRNLLQEIYSLVFSKDWYIRSEAAKTLLSFGKESLPLVKSILNSEDEYAKYSLGDEISKSRYIEILLRENINEIEYKDVDEILKILDRLGYKSLKEGVKHDFS